MAPVSTEAEAAAESLRVTALTTQMMDEVFSKLVEQRDQLAAFYDVRVLFAAYTEILSGLAAAMIHAGVYPRDGVAHLLTELMVSAITRESTTTVERRTGQDVIQSVKQ
jgi:hypothetical protein